MEKVTSEVDGEVPIAAADDMFFLLASLHEDVPLVIIGLIMDKYIQFAPLDFPIALLHIHRDEQAFWMFLLRSVPYNDNVISISLCVDSFCIQITQKVGYCRVADMHTDY